MTLITTQLIAAAAVGFFCICAIFYLAHSLAAARAAGREALIRLSAEQHAHSVARDALATAGAELAQLREKLAEAAKRPKSVECDEMLRELMSGGALLKVSLIDAGDVFMLSPRTTR